MEESNEPKSILLNHCIMGVLRWESERKILEAKGGTVVPAGCPAEKLFVPPRLRSQVLLWGHTSKVACHPGVCRTFHLITHTQFWWL